MPSPTDRNLTALPTKTAKPTRHFTQLDQVTQLVAARDADPELGFMARLLALCSLPRAKPRQPSAIQACERPVHALHGGPAAAIN